MNRPKMPQNLISQVSPGSSAVIPVSSQMPQHAMGQQNLQLGNSQNQAALRFQLNSKRYSNAKDVAMAHQQPIQVPVQTVGAN